MKKLLLFTLLLSSIFAHAQFDEINSPTTKSLWDIHFVDADNGIIVGDSGTILKSIDGGLNWDIIMENPDINFKKVKFFDAQNGITIGSHIYTTNNGGSTWTNIPVSNTGFIDIAILNNSACLLSGSPTALIKSTDKGQTWTTLVEEDIEQSIGLLSFINEQIGYSIYRSGSVITNTFKTIDGGESWVQISAESGEQITILEAVSFTSEDVGFRGGWYDSHLAKTEDSAHNWSSVIFNGETEFWEQAIYDFHIDKAVPNTYYACGWYGNVFKSNDYGDNWRELAFSDNAILYAIFFIDDNVGWTVGQFGKIYKTTNGGGASAGLNCNLISWDFIKDTVNISGEPAVQIQLSTEMNTFNTGYTTFLITNNGGDTIVDYSDEPSFWMPAVESVGNPIVSYILDLESPFTSIGDNFNGLLITTNTDCEFSLDMLSQTTSLGSKNYQFFPNPFTTQLVISSKNMTSSAIEIYDVRGATIYSNNLFTNEDIIINTNDWAAGIYFIKSGDSIKKLVKI